MHHQEFRVSVLGGVRVGGRLRQLFVVIEYFPSVLLRPHTDHRQTEGRFLLNSGVRWSRIEVRFADSCIERLTRLVSISGQKICATIKIQKLRIWRVEGTLNSGRQQL